MCGITGILNAKKDESHQLNLMMDAIKHRGPDDFGSHVDMDRGVLLGSRRLSIQDLSELGRMPMKNLAGDLYVVQNGEIYNYPELRGELESFGYKFISNSDTEAILHGYDKWGIDVLQRLRGMFALVIFDKKRNKVFLIRDRLGIKPIYYLDFKGTFYFASEVKAFKTISGFNFVDHLDYEKIQLLLGFMFLPDNESTIIHGIKKLAPASYLEINLGNFIYVQKTYWQLNPNINNVTHMDFGDAVSRLDNLLFETVKQHLISDVPLGVMLSGGLDSSLISALVKKATSSDVTTFTATFNHKMNEAPFAKKVSEHIGTKHTELFISADEINANLETYIADFDDLTTFDGGLITTKLLCREIKKRGITVLLLGEGSDEIFGGYSWFGLSKQPFNLLPSRLLSAIYYYAISRNTSFNLFKNISVWNKVVNTGFDASIFDRISRAEITTQLPNHFLMKVDKGSMSQSIEARVPYLDHKLVEYVFSLPEKFKIDGNIVDLKNSKEKYILRKVAEKYLPLDIVYRKKRGFMLPMDDVLKANKEKVRAYVHESSSISRKLLSSDYIDYLFEPSLLKAQNTSKEYMLWRLFLLEIWVKSYGK